MKYLNLSKCLKNGIKEYPGDIKFNIKTRYEEKSFISDIHGCLHTGTHIDSPNHYIKNGNKVSKIKLEKLIGKASLIKNNSSKKEILLKNLEFEKPLEKIVIINTLTSDNLIEDEYFYNNYYLSNEVSEYLIKNNVKGVAIDSCSVDKFGESKIHEKLLKNNIWIVENLINCEKIKKSKVNAYFIPLHIEAESSYVRAFIEK